jgi:hypothetical protein
MTEQQPERHEDLPDKSADERVEKQSGVEAKTDKAECDPSGRAGSDAAGSDVVGSAAAASEAVSSEKDADATSATPPDHGTTTETNKTNTNSSAQKKTSNERKSGSDTLTSQQIAKQISDQLGAWMGEDNKDLASKIEFALNSVVKLAGQGFESVKASIALLTEFLQDLTSIESLRIIPKASMSLEVDIRCKLEQEVIVKQSIAPFVELYALHLGERIHFEALVNKEKKGLQLDVNEGMHLMILAPLIGVQMVPIKGSALLTRDETGQLAIVVTTPVPGVDTPISVTVPLRHFGNYAQSELRKKFKGSST